MRRAQQTWENFSGLYFFDEPSGYPGLANEIQSMLECACARIELGGHPTAYLLGSYKHVEVSTCFHRCNPARSVSPCVKDNSHVQQLSKGQSMLSAPFTAQAELAEACPRYMQRDLPLTKVDLPTTCCGEKKRSRECPQTAAPGPGTRRA